MKKILLLIASISIAGFANGQAVKNSAFQPGAAQNSTVPHPASKDNTTNTMPPAAGYDRHSGLRTTTGGSRWYDYTGFILANESSIPCNPVAALSSTRLDLWNDTTAIFGHTDGTSVYIANDFTSAGLFFDPFDSTCSGFGWNSYSPFTTVIEITPADAYTIDSVEVSGWYNRSYATPAKDSVIDTLILTFTYGMNATTANYPDEYLSGALASDYCMTTTGQVHYLDMLHDSIYNRAGNLSGTSVVSVPMAQVYKICLNQSDTNNFNDLFNTQYPRTGITATSSRPLDPVINFSVPAGNYSSMSVTFKSGDASYPTTPLTGPGGLAFPGAYDTVRTSTGIGGTVNYKYNNYSANIIFAAPASMSTIANFPPYNWPNDHTSGFFKKENTGAWGGKYIPNWYFTDYGGTAASKLQYPLIKYHVVCPTCAVIGPCSTLGSTNNVSKTNLITASPNPANVELTISFSLSQNASISVTLTNMLGQVVASQKINNAMEGIATFNTSPLPNGVYIYTLESNGLRQTGRVIVAHN